MALHRYLFDRVIIYNGIDRLQANHETRIKNFIQLYLGTPERPIAFGGRDQELRALDRWLENDAAPSCALLAGPAGRGKSALLVHWIKDCRHRRASP